MEEEEAITISCHVDANPAATVTFVIDGKTVDVGDSVNNDSTYFTNAKNGSVVMCIATNHLRVNKTLMVNICDVRECVDESIDDLDDLEYYEEESSDEQYTREYDDDGEEDYNSHDNVDNIYNVFEKIHATDDEKILKIDKKEIDEIPEKTDERAYTVPVTEEEMKEMVIEKTSFQDLDKEEITEKVTEKTSSQDVDVQEITEKVIVTSSTDVQVLLNIKNTTRKENGFVKTNQSNAADKKENDYEKHFQEYVSANVVEKKENDIKENNKMNTEHSTIREEKGGFVEETFGDDSFEDDSFKDLSLLLDAKEELKEMTEERIEIIDYKAIQRKDQETKTTKSNDVNIYDNLVSSSNSNGINVDLMLFIIFFIIVISLFSCCSIAICFYACRTRDTQPTLSISINQ